MILEGRPISFAIAFRRPGMIPCNSRQILIASSRRPTLDLFFFITRFLIPTSQRYWVAATCRPRNFLLDTLKYVKEPLGTQLQFRTMQDFPHQLLVRSRRRQTNFLPIVIPRMLERTFAPSQADVLARKSIVRRVGNEFLTRLGVEWIGVQPETHNRLSTNHRFRQLRGERHHFLPLHFGAKGFFALFCSFFGFFLKCVAKFRLCPHGLRRHTWPPSGEAGP